MNRVTSCTVVRETSFGRCLIDQLHLVDHDSRLQGISLGDHEESVQHPAVRLRFGRSEDDNNLIDVRGDDSLSLASPWSASRELRATRKNFGNRPMGPALVHLQRYAITDRKLFAFVALLLEPAAQ